VRFDAEQLHDQFRRAVMKRIKDGQLSAKEGNDLIDFYQDQAESYTYLTPNGGGRK
jgi:arginine decarboxylase-like protein